MSEKLPERFFSTFMTLKDISCAITSFSTIKTQATSSSTLKASMSSPAGTRVP